MHNGDESTGQGSRSRLFRMPIVLALLCLLAALPAPAQEHRLTFTEVHLGVPVRLVLFAADSTRARVAARSAFDRIAGIDGALSDYRPDSDLRLLEHAAADTLVPISDDLFLALSAALTMARETDGAFDPTAGALTRLWRGARDRGRIPDSVAVAAALAQGGWQRVTLDTARRAARVPRDLQFDLGGIGKGYALQQAYALLRTRGVTRVLLEAGGDVLVGEAPPGAEGWEITGLDEDGPPRYLVDAALSTSGSHEQFVEVAGRRYSHVIDPRTGWALTHTDAVSVIASDAITADALSTAFSVLGRDRSLALADRWRALLALRWH
jgi:thiamine biosynthesis lipoprotein